MGLLLLQLLNRAGARSVAVVDRKASRLEAATAVGAVRVATDVAELGPGLFGVAVDATGPLPGQPYRLREFAAALAAVRDGEGIKIQVTPGR
jgi:threonine dehydrogenase-like Zn-dependent dehydrogenase